ncbi:MAG: sensor histidine kinase [Nitriliruptorales bacterium]|nr:sensor histidine kinase [Nitriliruptorales bacterium]
MSLGPKAVVAAIAVVAAAGLFLAIQRTSQTVSEPRTAERVEAARSIAASLEQLFDSAEAQARTIALALEPWSPDDPDRLEELGRFRGAASLLTGGLLVLDDNGTVVTADPSRAQLIGRRIDGWQPAGGVTLSGLLEDPLTGERAVIVQAPIDGTRATLRATMPGRLLSAHLATMGVPDGAELALVDPDRTVITTGGEGATTLAGANLRTPARLAASGAGHTLFEGEAGDDRFAAFAPVEGGWSIVLSDSAASFLGGWRSPIAITYLIAMLLLIAVGAIILMERRRADEARTQLDHAKRALLSVAGHELRTPLTVVRGLTRTLLNHWDRTDEPRRRELLMTIERQSRSLEHLLERLLYVAELEAGAAGALRPREVDVAEVVRSAVSAHAALAPAHTLIAHAPEPARAWADPHALDEVLFHLLENAVRYSPGGGEIIGSVIQVGSRVEIAVEDQGIGLPADPEVVFERFQQQEAVDTRTLEEGGLGLGLHIVRSLIEAMGGQVTAENRPEGGARFIVQLDALAADEEHVAPQPTSEPEEPVHAT